MRVLAITARLWGLSTPSRLIDWTQGADPQLLKVTAVGRLELGLDRDGVSLLEPQCLAANVQHIDLTARPIQVAETIWQPRARPRSNPKPLQTQIDLTQFAV
jgi:hypothetical protein